MDLSDLSRFLTTGAQKVSRAANPAKRTLYTFEHRFMLEIPSEVPKTGLVGFSLTEGATMANGFRFWHEKLDVYRGRAGASPLIPGARHART